MNEAKLKQAFATALGLGIAAIHDDMAYATIPEWDSARHMSLVAEIEDTFNVMLDTDDIVDMSSVKKAREILAKYGIVFNVTKAA